MNHGNEDNFEAMLRGEAATPAEGTLDRDLARRLETHRAIRSRLQRAFAGVRPDAGLEVRLRRRLADAESRSAAPRTARETFWGRLRVGRPRLVPALAVAALIVAAAIPLSVLFLQQSVQAAQEEFATIHERHQPGGERLFVAADVAEMAAHLRAELPYEAGVPRVRPGDKVSGCCVDRFRGEPAGSYILDTPQGRVSFIVSQAAPETLNLRHQTDRGGRTVFSCGYGDCRMAGVRANGVSYYVVGKMPREALIDLLMQVVPGAGTSGDGA